MFILSYVILYFINIYINHGNQMFIQCDMQETNTCSVSKQYGPSRNPDVVCQSRLSSNSSEWSEIWNSVSMGMSYMSLGIMPDP